MKTDVIINRDALYALRELPGESVNCCVTSPPYYGLRDYGLDMQIGREDTPEQYIDRLVEVFRELRRVLKDDGTFWLNIADTYCGTGMKAGCKQKDLIGIPWLLAFALRSDGWYLRSDIIWLKENRRKHNIFEKLTCSRAGRTSSRSRCLHPKAANLHQERYSVLSELTQRETATLHVGDATRRERRGRPAKIVMIECSLVHKTVCLRGLCQKLTI